MNIEQYIEYMTSISRVKGARIKSIFREDGVFLNDDDIKAQIGELLKTEDIDEYVIQASIDTFIIKTIPDNNGNADVDVCFKPIISYANIGLYQLGGAAKLKRKETKIPRQILNVKVMNV